MKTKLLFMLSTIMMAMSLLVTSCKENEEVQPEFTFAEDAVILIEDVMAQVDDWLITVNSSGTLFIGDRNSGQPYSYPYTKWSSSDQSVVSVSESEGDKIEIKALKVGSATITASDDKGNKRTLIINVKGEFTFANDAAILIDGIQGSQESYNLESSATANLSIGKYWNMERYDYPSTKWSSSDPSIVKVSNAVGSKTTITALKEGTATITANDSEGNKLALVVIVQEFKFADDAVILIEDLMAQVDEYALKINASETLFIGSKDNGQPYSYPKTEWSSSNPSVVSVANTEGEEVVIKALKGGSATITAEDALGNELTLIIYVNAPAKVGDFYYDNHTWSSIEDVNRKVIGFVIEVGSDNYSGTVVACRETDFQIQFDTRENKGGLFENGIAVSSFFGIQNTKEMLDYCLAENSNTQTFLDNYPILKSIYSMNPQGASYINGTKRVWYLPALEQLKMVLSNSEQIHDKRLIIPKNSKSVFICSTITYLEDVAAVGNVLCYSESKNSWEKYIQQLREYFNYLVIMDF